jgi:hypothetical protein
LPRFENATTAQTRCTSTRQQKHESLRIPRHPPSPNTNSIPLRLYWCTASAIAIAQPQAPNPNRHGKPVATGRFLQKKPVAPPPPPTNLANPSAAARSAKPGIRTPRRRGDPGRNRGIEGAGRQGEKRRRLTSPGARRARIRFRSSGDRTAPPPRSGRRRGAPKSRIAQAKGEAFSADFLIGVKMAPASLGL